MSEGGIVKVKSYDQLKRVSVVNVEGEDKDGVVIFPRILVKDLNTKSEFWAHLGENDERNHTSKSYGQLLKSGNGTTIRAMFSLRNFWLNYGSPEKETSITSTNQVLAQWRPAVLRIWRSPLTKSEAAIGPEESSADYAKWEESMKKKRVFWVVADTQSGGTGGSSECCYWS